MPHIKIVSFNDSSDEGCLSSLSIGSKKKDCTQDFSCAINPSQPPSINLVFLGLQEDVHRQVCKMFDAALEVLSGAAWGFLDGYSLLAWAGYVQGNAILLLGGVGEISRSQAEVSMRSMDYVLQWAGPVAGLRR